MPGVATSTTLQYTGIAIFVAIVVYVVLYYSRSFESVFLTRHHDATANLATGDHAARPGPVQALGLGPDDVAVLPTFTYHSAAASPEIFRGKARNNAKADCCAVCLEELHDGALVRMLASCKHYFHADCVDVWLLSHATCPVCRGSPGQEMVRLGVASLSPPLPQLRRFGAPSSSLPEPEETGRTSSPSRGRDVVSSSSLSPVIRSPMRFHQVSTSRNGGSSAAMSPSPPDHRPRTPPEGGIYRTSRSPSPVTTGSNGAVQV